MVVMHRVETFYLMGFVLMLAGPARPESNIDPSHKFAWGENVGWLNWRDANDGRSGVQVNATFLSGYIWAENVGWINVGNGLPANGVSYANVDGSEFGVNILANGDLEGYGWGENIGWVNFGTGAVTPNQARYDASSARFRGYAWGENVGWINLDDPVHYVGVACTIAGPPVAEPTVPDAGYGTRVRYLAFGAGTPDKLQGIRVKFTDLPAPFEYSEGRAMWVGQPIDVSEVAGKDDATPPTFKLAQLQCDPFFTDWTQYGAVYVHSESLVPQGLYDIQAIDDTCLPTEEANFSDPLPIRLSKWGDTVGGNNAASPQGTMDFVDISSVVDKFKNLPGAPAKSRADVAPSLPDKIIDFTDIPAIVDAFKGNAYPYPGPPVDDPCD